MKKTYTIDKIPSFRYEIDYPRGLSAIFNELGRADAYLFGEWATWDNIHYREEPDYLGSIERFFRFLNHPRYYTDSDLARLDNLNKSELARLMFQHLGGWKFDFYDCEPNSNTFIIRRVEKTYRCHFELCPAYAYDPQMKIRYISYYDYEFYSSVKAGNPNEKKVISAREGLDLIELMRLSFLAMIYNYKKEHCTEIRVFNGWHNYKENLIDLCIQNNLI